nr:MAG TPA: hypothetical protein [Caudoviricetes sp.]
MLHHHSNVLSIYNIIFHYFDRSRLHHHNY